MCETTNPKSGGDMDPAQILRDILDTFASSNSASSTAVHETTEGLRNLAEWIDKGGFFPAVRKSGGGNYYVRLSYYYVWLSRQS